MTTRRDLLKVGAAGATLAGATIPTGPALAAQDDAILTAWRRWHTISVKRWSLGYQLDAIDIPFRDFMNGDDPKLLAMKEATGYRVLDDMYKSLDAFADEAQDDLERLCKGQSSAISAAAMIDMFCLDLQECYDMWDGFLYQSIRALIPQVPPEIGRALAVWHEDHDHEESVAILMAQQAAEV